MTRAVVRADFHRIDDEFLEFVAGENEVVAVFVADELVGFADRARVVAESCWFDDEEREGEEWKRK